MKTWQIHPVPEARPPAQPFIKLRSPRQMPTAAARCCASVSIFIRFVGVID
jgi:hypothetical protein